MAKIDTYLTVRQVLSKLGLQAQDMAAHPRKADKSSKIKQWRILPADLDEFGKVRTNK